MSLLTRSWTALYEAWATSTGLANGRKPGAGLLALTTRDRRRLVRCRQVGYLSSYVDRGAGVCAKSWPGGSTMQHVMLVLVLKLGQGKHVLAMRRSTQLRPLALGRLGSVINSTNGVGLDSQECAHDDPGDAHL